MNIKQNKNKWKFRIHKQKGVIHKDIKINRKVKHINVNLES